MSFPTTNWTMLARASLNGDTTGRVALEDMCRNYWAPVRAAVARRWPWPGEEDDLTQDFFVHLMERGALRRADRERGRFRSYLLGALKFYLSHRLEAAHAAKRGGGRKAEDLQEWMAPVDAADPDFDRAWAIQLLTRALDRLEGESGAKAYGSLRVFLPGVGAASDAPPSYEEAARILGRPLGTLKSDVSRLRQRLREIIRMEVARTVSAPHEIDEEVAYLHRMLRQ